MPHPAKPNELSIEIEVDRIAAEFRVAAMNNDLSALSILAPNLKCDRSATAEKIGRTALHWAIITQSDAAIRFLLELGMGVTIPDVEDETPYSLLRKYNIQDDNKRKIVLQTMIEQYATMMFKEMREFELLVQLKMTKREEDHVKHLIAKMSKQIKSCYEQMKGCTDLGLMQCQGAQRDCLDNSLRCIQSTWEEISTYYQTIHFGVTLLDSGAYAEWLFNEILLWLSKAECNVPALLSGMEKGVKQHTDLLNKSCANTKFKNKLLKKIDDIKQILLETLRIIKENAERLGAGLQEGPPYEGFCEMMRKYVEAGHDIDALHLMSEDKMAIMLGKVFKCYDKRQHTKWTIFQIDKFKQDVEGKLLLLDTVMQKTPYAFSETEREECRKTMLKIFTVILDSELKTTIEQTSALELNRFYQEKSFALDDVLCASRIFIVIKRMRLSVFKVVDKMLNNNSLLFPKDTRVLQPTIGTNQQDQKEDTETHAEVILREKRWKKEQEAAQREVQRKMAILFQHNKQEKKAEEERKYTMEERHKVYRTQILQGLALCPNNASVFYAILDPKKSQEIKWNDLLTLGEILGARLENNKCIFSLFDLGTVTFHKGHGKDKSEYANASGIDALRTLLNQMGFENETFRCSKTGPKQ